MEPQDIIDKAPSAIDQIMQVLVNAGDEPITWAVVIGTMALIGLKIWRRK